jgi:hypothetical protein
MPLNWILLFRFSAIAMAGKLIGIGLFAKIPGGRLKKFSVGLYTVFF